MSILYEVWKSEKLQPYKQENNVGARQAVSSVLETAYLLGFFEKKRKKHPVSNNRSEEKGQTGSI